MKHRLNLYSFRSIANQKSVRYSVTISYFTNIAVQNINEFDFLLLIYEIYIILFSRGSETCGPVWNETFLCAGHILHVRQILVNIYIGVHSAYMPYWHAGGTLINYAPINVNPEGGGVGQGVGI